MSSSEFSYSNHATLFKDELSVQLTTSELLVGNLDAINGLNNQSDDLSYLVT